MKLLFVNPTGALGGAERVLLGAIRAVRQARPATQCHLLALSPGPLLEHARDLGVQATVLPAPGRLLSFGDSRLRLLSLLWQGLPLAWSTWRYVRQLRRQLRALGPDLIHSNGIKTHALLSLAGSNGVPVLWHVHDFLSRRSLARRVLGRGVGRIAGAIAISNAVADDLHSLWPGLTVHTVANAVDTRSFCPGPADPALLDRLANLPPRPCLRVGLVATYARWKGHDVFLRAAARVLREHPEMPVRFYIIGGPIYQTQGSQFNRAELQELTRQMSPAGEVGFIDFQQDVRPIYRALDVVVHASTAPEPFGLTIIEAMACGKAVIVAQAGGAAEIIRSGHDALGVPPGDVGALAAALAQLLKDDTLRSALGAQARTSVCERFDQARFDAEWVNLIERLRCQAGLSVLCRCFVPRSRPSRAKHTESRKRMSMLLGLLDFMPASWIRAASAVRGKSRLVKRMTDWLPGMIRNKDGRIQKGLGRGLLFNGGDSAVAFLLGTHDLDVQHAIHRLVKPGMIAYDIGANVGFTALLAAQQVGPSGKVICFEPLARNAERIQYNAALNGFRTIAVQQIALGETDGEAEFQTSESPTWGRLSAAGATPLPAAAIKVSVRSLDSLIANDGVALPRFIKMDVEGAEASVLRGGRKLLAESRPVMVIELHHTYAAVVDALQGLKFTVRILTPGVTSSAGELQILVYPAENAELDACWAEIAAGGIQFQ